MAFESEVASEKPAPGGGSVSALTGSLAASLVTMVARLTLNKAEYEQDWPKIKEIVAESEALRQRLLELVDEDSRTFMKLMEAYRLPRSTEMEKSKRAIEIQSRLKSATEIPLTTAQNAARILSLSKSLSECGNKNALSDVQTAVFLSHASTLGALSNVSINLME
jgi:formiminotetrahydrofolate cyclodeaminase